VLVLLAGWTVFAFAHSYRLTMLPLAGGVALLAVFRPPAIGRHPARILDLALILSLGAIAVQLVPLPDMLRERIAPAAMAYDRVMRVGDSTGAARPLSIEPAATVLALIATASMVLLFWCARTVFQRGGVRATIRGIAWIGLLVSPLAIVDHIMPLPGIDQIWDTTLSRVRPFGPFVNRNDLAGWLIMAIPLTLGYGIARMQSRHRAGAAIEADAVVDSTAIWLGMAACLMLGGLLFSLSRSGLLGAAAGAVVFGWLARRRLTARRAVWAGAALLAMFAVAATYADFGALALRFQSSFADGMPGRVSIWRQTLPVVRNFWPLGSGAGTYQSVMVLYQTMSRYFYISHADNEVLQILAEGGLLLGLPVVIAIGAGVVVVAGRLRDDRTAMFWVRAGAAAGMAAVAAQNMVEMTLRVPANSLLFALSAAIAMHHEKLDR
jgi:O-antigen ligase